MHEFYKDWPLIRYIVSIVLVAKLILFFLFLRVLLVSCVLTQLWIVFIPVAQTLWQDPSQARRTKGGETAPCVCVLSDWVNSNTSPEEWEHSEIITLSLHINWGLKEDEGLCLRVRGTEQREGFWAFVKLTKPNTHTSFLIKKKRFHASGLIWL